MNRAIDCATRRELVQAGLDRYAIGGMFAELNPRLRVASGKVRVGMVRCELVLTIQDVTDGVRRDFVTAFFVDSRVSSDTWAPHIQAAVMERMRHELGESLALDGKLVANPHMETR